MTKKVTKKNLFYLFPKTEQKSNANNFGGLKDEGVGVKAEHSDAVGIDVPDGNSDWQAHHDFLESEGWGSGLFGAPLDKEIEEVALRAVKLANETNDAEKIAKSYRHLFYLYCEFNHPQSLAVGYKSVIAAARAYGTATPEVGEEVAMLADVHEFIKNFDQAIIARDATIKIFRKNGTDERLFEALESAIDAASDMGRPEKVEEYARCGIRLVKQRCKKGSDDYETNMDYFKQMLATANDPPVPIEEQRRQLQALREHLRAVKLQIDS
jgi:tetratricopeptide (TPR) repeat protein